MSVHPVVKFSFHLAFTALMVLSATIPAYGANLTQRDWMVALVDTLGWTFGLPDEPQDPDYMNILTGNRNLRLEAEDIFTQGEDAVSLMSFRNYGDYSGKGWLQGTNQPTEVHLNFVLPVKGRYRLQTKIRKPGHQFTIGDQTAIADGTEKFIESKVGEFILEAGAQEILVVLPPSGAIDYIALAAPNLAAITPDQGWQPEEPLSWAVLNTTMLQLLQLADAFPLESSPLIFEAENIKATEAEVVTVKHLGVPSGGKWLRTSSRPAQVSFPFELPTAGFYDVSIRAIGKPINILVNDHYEIEFQGKPYLDQLELGPLFFFSGNNTITLRLPPGGGIDKLTLTARWISPEATQTLLGTNQAAQPATADLDSLTSLLAAFGVER